LQNPEAYKTIRDDDTFNVRIIVEYFASSLYQGLVLYFTMILGYGEGIRMADGREFGGYFLTTACMAFFVLTTVLIKWSFVIKYPCFLPSFLPCFLPWRINLDLPSPS